MAQKSGNKLFLTFGLIIVLILLVATFSISTSLTGNSIFDIFGKLFYSPQEVSVQGLLTSVTRDVSSNVYLPFVPISVTINLTFDPEDCGGAYVETIPNGFVVENNSITGIGAPYYNTNLNTIVWAPIDGPLCGGTSNELLSYNLTAVSASSSSSAISGQFSVDGTTYPNPDDILTIGTQNLDFTISNGGDISAVVDENSSREVTANIMLEQESDEGLVSLYAYDVTENLSVSFSPASCYLGGLDGNSTCTSLMNITLLSLRSYNYTLIVNATTGVLTKSTSFVLSVDGITDVVVIPDPDPEPTPTKTGGKKSSSSSPSTPVAVPVVVNKTPQTYDILAEQLAKGYIRALEQDDKLLFSIYGDSHSIKVLNVSEVSVSLEVRSTPFNIAIDKGQVKDLDLNDDSKNDLRVRYDGSTLGKAIVYVQSLSFTEASNNNSTSAPNNGQVINQQSARVLLIGIIVLIIVIVIILAIISFARKKDNK